MRSQADPTSRQVGSSSIGTQLLMLVLGISIPATALLAYTIAIYVKAGVSHERRGLERTARQVARFVARDISDARETMKHIAALPSVKRMDPDSCHGAFRVLPPLDPLTDQLALRGLDGHLVCSFLPHPAAVSPTLPWFALGLKRRAFTASAPWLGRNTKRWVSVLTFPVRDAAGQQVGMVILPLDLEELQRRNLSHVAPLYEASVLDSRGRFVLRSRGQARWVDTSSAAGSLSAMQQRVVPGPAKYTDGGGITLLRAAAAIPGTDWVAVATMQENSLVSAELARAKPVLALGISLLLAAMLLAYTLARWISRPIRRIGAAARAVSAGDLDVRIEPDGPSELRAVTVEFNRMLEAKVLVDRETHEHQQWASRLLENASDLALIVDRDHRIKYASPSIREMTGHEARAVLGLSYLEFLHPDDASACIADLNAAAASRRPTELREMRFRRQDGRWATVQTVAKNILEDPTLAGIVLSVRDVTERKHSLVALARQKDFYQILSETNQAIVRVKSRDELFSEICRIAVTHAHIRFATVALLEGDGPQVRLVAKYGHHADLLDRVITSAPPQEEGENDPVSTAIRTNRRVVANDYERDVEGNWREEARRAGLRAGAAFPIRVGGSVTGAIYLCSAEPSFFTDDIVAPLETMAADVSFALDNFAREAERARVRQELQFRTTVLETQQGASLDAILLVDADGKILSYNQQFVELFQVPAEIARDGDGLMLEWMTARASDRDQFLARVQYLNTHREDKAREEFELKDGRVVDRYSSPVVDRDGHYYGRVWYFRDVTPQRDAEKRLDRLNVLYATLSASNSAVIRARSQAELSASICRVIDHYGRGIAAWIGFFDSPTHRIVPGAWTASMSDVLPRALVRPGPSSSSENNPINIAARTGSPYFCDDVFGDSAFQPWYELCTEYGVVSAAIIPLRVASSSVGAISLYAAQKEFFTADMKALLKELGDDMSYALESLDRERRRQEAENALVESEAKYRGLVEQDLTGIYIIQDGRLVYTNPYLARLFGYGVAEILGMEIRLLVHPADRALVEEKLRQRLDGEIGALKYSFHALRKDGSSFTVGVHGSPSVFSGHPAIIGLMQDITEKKKAEEIEKTHLRDLERAMLGTIDAVSAMVEIRDPYTAGHEIRVGKLASAIGRELGLPERTVEGLRIAGALHDIGKIGCPAEILSKPSRLSQTEYALVKQHSQLGYDILKSVNFPWPIADITLQHHERMDGSGYPRGLHGDQIMLEARILAVADTVEAIASHRPYRPARGIDAALREVETQSGKRYDPQVVSACLRLFKERRFAFTP